MQLFLHLKCKQFLWGVGEMVLTELMFTQELFTSGLKWRICYTTQLFYSCNHFAFRCTLFRVHCTWFKSFRFRWALDCLIDKTNTTTFLKERVKLLDVLCEWKLLWLSFHERQNPKWLAQKGVYGYTLPCPLQTHHTHTHPLFSGSRS